MKRQVGFERWGIRKIWRVINAMIRLSGNLEENWSGKRHWSLITVEMPTSRNTGSIKDKLLHLYFN